MSGTTISSTASGSGQKVPKFAAKAGFVIPKNKLSGSLVPIFRGGKKLGANGMLDDESTKQDPRKTKWGPDLTQDAAVKRGRALAYQTRVDQITQQLKSGISMIEDGGDLALGSESPDRESPGCQIDSEKAEELELEKREVIGEILKLNPSYDVPSDYKPLLKEAKVSIPVKQYPGYNFVGLVFGPGGDNQKRLEKETGAKIQVYGMKVEGGQKVEIKPSDGNQIHSPYEDLYVHISADIFEKVDAAVSVIELLITSVSGNLAPASTSSNSASEDDVNVQLGQDVATNDLGHSYAIQPVHGPRLVLPQGQFQSPGQWLPSGPLNTALHPPSSFIPSPNSSATPVNNPAHMSTPTFRPSNMYSLFGPPPLPTGCNSLPQNQSLVSPRLQPPGQYPQHPYMAQTTRNPSPIAPQLPPVQAHNISAPLPSTGSQLPPMGITGPSMTSLPQPVSSLPPGSLPVNTPLSAGFINMTQMTPRMVPTNGIYPAVPPLNISTAISVSPLNPPPTYPGFPSVLQPQMGPTPSLSASISSTPVPVPVLGSALNPSPGISSVSGSVRNFAPVITPPLPTAPGPGNFTFQAGRPQNAAFQAVPWTGNQFGTQSAPHSILQPPPSQQPLSVFRRPQVGNNMGQPQPQPHMYRNQTGILGPGLPTFPDASGVALRNQILQVGPRNFSPTTQMPGYPGALPSRPGSLVPLQNYPVPLQNYPVQRMRSETPLAQNRQLNHNLSFTSGRSASTPGEQQLYDPFSPTSISIASQQLQGGIPRR
ncbi:splicing factor 1 isoform X1 [Morus notabilis]|uniref:splicing factor 1 isoform X1 n=2 Tax=Morus notabilis TaxID=981085 RepID=UPI000CED045C|nr:splicing factor 1 isoform X1 [Morus notabilis]